MDTIVVPFLNYDSYNFWGINPKYFGFIPTETPAYHF